MFKQFKTLRFVTVATFGLLLCGQSDAQEDFPSIYVIGEASVMVEPDVIEWSLTLDTRDAEPEEALELNSIMMESVIDLVEDLDIDEDDFETTQGRLRRVYDYPRNGREEREYLYTKCVRRATIRMRDFEQFDELMVALVGMGIEFEIAYQISNIDEIKRPLSLEALRNAKEIAEEQAEVLGEAVGRAHSIEVYQESDRNWGGGGGLFGDDSEPERDTNRPGKVRVEMRAQVTFTLVP